MKFIRRTPKLANEGMTHVLALACLLLLGGMAVAGPSGLLAWQENHQLLIERQAQIKQLTLVRDDLRNRVALLDPRNTDPDLAGELLRRNLNVAHPDEMIMLVH